MINHSSLIQRTTRARRRCLIASSSALLAVACSLTLQAQATGAAAPTTRATAPIASVGKATPAASDSAKPAPQPSASARRRAAKLYLDAGKLYEAGHFEAAMKMYEQAAALDPTNIDYPAAAGVARSHQVTALVQAAAKARLAGDAAGARAQLARALALDPTNPVVTQHLYELADEATGGRQEPLYYPARLAFGGPVELSPASGLHSFHERTMERTLIEHVFAAYGISVVMDDSVRNQQIPFDADNLNYADTMKVLAAATGTFFVPLEAHRVLVARDTNANRTQFSRQIVETVNLGGLSESDVSEVQNLAKNVFNIQSVNASGGGAAAVAPAAPAPVQPPVTNPALGGSPLGARPTTPNFPQAAASQTTAQTPGPSEAAAILTLRATQETLDAFNATVRDLVEGHNQVMLDVRLVQLAQNSTRNNGAQLPQSMGVFNVAAEAESVLNANQALVQQIISSGLASPTDYLAILGILVASGQVSNSPLAGGIATFGGSLTNCTSGITSCSGALSTYAIAPGSASFNLNLNSSESRNLDEVQLRLGDGEAGTLKLGEKYPIQTSSYSSVAPNLPNIPGLTGAGSSSSLSSLVANLGGASTPIPQIQYQDLGLNLKVTPKVLRGGEIALTIDMKIDALSGSSLNGNPILDTQEYSSVVTLKEGETVEVASNMDKSQSRTVSGTPVLGQIPGMSDVADDTNLQKNYATMLIVITPHLIRGTQAAGRSAQMPVERGAGTP
jgi:Flp pilus assembly secretin CpaC